MYSFVILSIVRPRSVMVNAPLSGLPIGGDCRFDPCRGRFGSFENIITSEDPVSKHNSRTTRQYHDCCLPSRR